MKTVRRTWTEGEPVEIKYVNRGGFFKRVYGRVVYFGPYHDGDPIKPKEDTPSGVDYVRSPHNMPRQYIRGKVRPTPTDYLLVREKSGTEIWHNLSNSVVNRAVWKIKDPVKRGRIEEALRNGAA